MGEALEREAGELPRARDGRGPPLPSAGSTGLTLGIEPVAVHWRELDALAREEHAEVEEGSRPFGPDWHSIIVLEARGTFKTVVARKDGEIVGYMAWMIDFDIEAYGVLIAQQGAWYVKPNMFGVAVRMFDWSINELRRLGVKFAYLHNSERGRGKSVGRFYERRGAAHTSNTYTLRL